MPSPEHVPFWEGLVPEEGTPRVSGEPFEAQRLGAHVGRRARTAAPRPRSTPPTSTRSFVSRRHKSHGDPRSGTGLQCGQFIVREASQRPVIKVYRSIYRYQVPVRYRFWGPCRSNFYVVWPIFNFQRVVSSKLL